MYSEICAQKSFIFLSVIFSDSDLDLQYWCQESVIIKKGRRTQETLVHKN
jgi:hypothetical protein